MLCMLPKKCLLIIHNNTHTLILHQSFKFWKLTTVWPFSDYATVKLSLVVIPCRLYMHRQLSINLFYACYYATTNNLIIIHNWLNFFGGGGFSLLAPLVLPPMNTTIMNVLYLCIYLGSLLSITLHHTCMWCTQTRKINPH